MRRGRGRAGDRGRAAAGGQRQDPRPGRGKERVRAVVRRRVQRVGLVGVRDADDAAVAGRELRRRRPVVAGRRDEDDAMRPGIVDRRLERGRVSGSRERHERDVGAVIGRPDEALDDVAVATRAVGAEDADRHDRDAVVPDAGDADAVVRRRGDDAGHRGPVAVRVGRRRLSRRATSRRRACRRGRAAKRRRRCRGRPRSPSRRWPSHRPESQPIFGSAHCEA